MRHPSLSLFLFLPSGKWGYRLGGADYRGFFWRETINKSNLAKLDWDKKYISPHPKSPGAIPPSPPHTLQVHNPNPEYQILHIKRHDVRILDTHTPIYFKLLIENALSVTAIVLWNEINDQSSNPGRSCFSYSTNPFAKGHNPSLQLTLSLSQTHTHTHKYNPMFWWGGCQRKKRA